MSALHGSAVIVQLLRRDDIGFGEGFRSLKSPIGCTQLSLALIDRGISSSLFTFSQGGSGCLAIWQCTHSIGSEAVKGRLPVSIS